MSSITIPINFIHQWVIKLQISSFIHISFDVRNALLFFLFEYVHSTFYFKRSFYFRNVFMWEDIQIHTN